MKKIFTALLVAVALPCGLWAKNDPGVVIPRTVILNPQDVPIFYRDSPLRGIEAFLVVTSFPVEMHLSLQQKLGKAIAASLKEIGNVAYLNNKQGINMQGMGAGTMVAIQVASVKTWKGQLLPLYRISLNVETAVTLDKTGMKSFPMVWSINTFLENGSGAHGFDELVNAMHKLLNDFVENYKYANPNQTVKPIFYSYDETVS
ncbi:hypothetical protein COB21_03915 [Candidatus Aerophobetes bacterium]|uniref:DUF4136 domain-containing protein n=1 Tax=Aerophobetes bacterium TaxID=2030807 RepID=A0A2A4X3S6_UNCAE|nr:MAG: hypothetical protein COB21_03915 [Candidatus Aerophobetes bacterium]